MKWLKNGIGKGFLFYAIIPALYLYIYLYNNFVG